MLTGLDIFCGAGGSSDGARTAGVTMLGGIDMDPVAVATWSDNFSEARGICARLEDVGDAELKASFGGVHLLLASPECTNHSPAKGSAPRCEASKDTALMALRYAQLLQPRWIVMENVIQMKPWSRFAELLQGLDELGYQTRSYVLDASDFGVAQRRRRLFVVADAEMDPPRSLIAPPSVALNVRSILDPDNQWRASPLRAERRAKDTLDRADRAIAALGEDEPFLLVYYGSDGSGGWQSLDRPLRTVTTLDRFALVTPTEGGHVMRMLQPSELKRAMGLSEAFKLDQGSRRDRIRLLGNGVCAPVMASVIAQITADPISLAPANAHGTLIQDDLFAAESDLHSDNLGSVIDTNSERLYS